MGLGAEKFSLTSLWLNTFQGSEIKEDISPKAIQAYHAKIRTKPTPDEDCSTLGLLLYSLNVDQRKNSVFECSPDDMH